METLRNIGDWTLWKWARLVFLLVVFGKPGAGQAGAPAVVEFRGQVLVDGVPFTGTGQFSFALVDRTGAFLVLEPPNGPIRTPISLPVNQGNYTVRFGVDTLPIPMDALSDREALALRVWFSDGTQELQQIEPDYPFDSVAYAQWSAGASFAVRASHAAIAAQAEAYSGPVAAGQLTGLINDGLLSRNIARLDSSPVFTGTVQAGGFEGPGSFRWVDRASPELMASPQTGYVALREDGPMVVTVPTSARAGDIIRVMGAGAGGWWIRDGSGALLASRPPGSRWIDRGAPFNGPLYDWRAAAVSADGTKLVLCSYGGQVFTSSDGGVEWTPRMPVQFWVSAAASRDGARWAACAHNGPVYLSTDGGMNWVPVTGNQAWRSVAISTDGNIIAACVDGGQIHISKDSGETWSTRGGQHKWSAVAISGAGLNMVACVDGGQVHTSSDGGDTWVARGTVQAWKSVASSVDGSRLVACVEGGHVYTSNDAGVTWVARGEARAWKAVACSGSGERLIAAVAGGGVHTSLDGGETWVAHEGVSGSGAIACSRDGATFIAAGDGVIRVSHGAMGADEMAELIYTTTGSWLVKVQAALDRTGSVGMDRIPDLSAAKITSGTFRPDLIPGLDAGHIRTGVLDAGRIPDLPASRITSGTLDPARIPSIGPEKLAEVPASKVTGTLTEAQLPASVARLDSSASFSGSVAAGVFRGQGTMPWVGVGEDTQVVSPNTGYLALRETGPVVFTLPASASVGDVIRFVGVGAGGWRVNDSRGGTKLPEPPGVHWAQRLGPAGWRQMACSADGSKVIALNPGVEIQVSTDGGLRWNARSIEGWPGAVTLSADGSRVIVCDPLSGFAYVSINLGGNWVKRPIPREIQGPSPVMASSASGMKVTVCSGSYMAHSEDGGLTWRLGLMANSGIWASVAASADGMYWVAAASGGSVYTSSNGGTNWAPVPALPTSASWTSVASSSDGRRLIACAKGEPLRFSTDAGATWGTRETARNWTSVSSAGDGSTVIACAEGGVMVVSADFGETWALRDGGQNWRRALVSSDGKRWFAMAAEGDVHSVYTSPSPARPAGVVGEFHYTGAGGWVHAEYATLDASGTLDRRLIPTLAAENLAGIPASKITSGVFDPNRIPGMDAIKLTSGSLLLARIPPLPANQITSGVFDPSRIPPLDASRIITGVLNLNRIPPLSAQNVRSGVFGGEQIPVTLSGRRNFLGNLLVAPAGFTPPTGTGSSPGGEPPLVLVRDQAINRVGYCLGINNRDGASWWRVGADDAARFSIGASGLRDYDISIDRNTGNVGIGIVPGNNKLTVAGVVLALGGVQTSSDARLKTAIEPLVSPLEVVERLRGVSFEWRAVPGRGVPVEGRQLGFLAQEVQSVLPELVKAGDDGHLSVNYDGVIPVLVEAIKELRHGYELELREKEARLAALEKRLERLEGRLTSRTIAAPDTGNANGN